MLHEFALYSVLLVIGLVVWHWLWVRDLGVEIPIDRDFKIASLNQRHLYYKTRTFSILADFFKNILLKFDCLYFSLHTGLDGYLYLLSQRHMLKLSAFIATCSVLISMPFRLFNHELNTDELQRSALSNKELDGFASWVHTLLVIAFTLVSFYLIFDFQDEVIMAYARTQDEKIRKYTHEPLKACTVHVRGVLPQDRRGD